MSNAFEKIKSWLGRAETSVEREAEGANPVTTPATGDPDRETSTNAQVEGAAGEPWPGQD